MVKVEIQIPKKLYELVLSLCAKFDYDINTFITEALYGDIEASSGDNFEPYLEPFVKTVKAQLSLIEKEIYSNQS